MTIVRRKSRKKIVLYETDRYYNP